ncbi:uncharacterized protein [Dermacentor albipictus]|uniref:uncharacterized protein n=1 Tax=Dermacentor albipictus TaxID=60249 RepID=UPI0038FCF568
MYRSPNHRTQSFRRLLKKARDKAGDNPLIIAGDLNAPKVEWGYGVTSAKGRNLATDAEEMGLNLITSALYPTRMGNSVSRDTTTDLTFVLNTEGATWHNTGDDLGSDHYIVETSIAIALKPLRKWRYTDWDEFRQIRKERTDKPVTLEQWTQELKEDARNATKEIETDVQTIGMDAKLAHMLEAKRSILQRWRTQRLNRRLRKKIALLNKDIEHHCVVLSNQQWDEVCARADGSVTYGKTWNLLKHLLSKGQTRSSQTKAADKIAKRELKNCNEQEFMARLAERYMPLSSSHENEAEASGSPYTGADNPDLDEPFTLEEIRTVLQNLNGTSAPGPKIGDIPNLNEVAHEAARALTDREASSNHSENKDAPTTYNEEEEGREK